MDTQTYCDAMSWLVKEKAKAHDKVRKDQTYRASIRNHAYMMDELVKFMREQKKATERVDKV